MYGTDLIALEKALKEMKEGNPLIPESFLLDSVLTKCRDLLVRNNYAVIKKPRTALKVKNVKGLVDLYYYILSATTNLTPYRDDKIDLVTAKRLVKHVQSSTGLNYELSLVKCIKIVEGLFVYKRQLNIHPEVMTTFKVFGQDRLGWITEKIVFLLNKEAHNEARLVASADAAADAYAKKHNIKFGWEDLEELANKIGD